MITRRRLIGGGLTAALVGAAGCTDQQQQNQQSSPYDNFGIRKLYSSLPGGQVWQASWEGGPWYHDPWLQRGSSDIHYQLDRGVLSVTGATSRLYIRNPDKRQQWGNVEITVYGMRISDGNVPYSGIVTDCRTNHGTTAPLEQNLGDSRGLVARIRFDGLADFGKEIRHPNTVATTPIRVFPGEMPKGEWIGYKHICHDLPMHIGTRQELWMDRTNGKNGGDWKLLYSHVDTGHALGMGEQPAVPGIDPAMPLTIGPRKGSESGLPNISVLIRADDLGRNGAGGLKYKWGSVREIV